MFGLTPAAASLDPPAYTGYLERLTAPVPVGEVARGAVAAVVSFEFFGSADGPGPAEFLAEAAGDLAVYRADPVMSVGSNQFDVPGLVSAFAAEIRALGAPSPALILVGHCSAARLAELVAAELGSRTPVPVTCVLVTPFFPGRDTVRAEFEELRARFDAPARPETATLPEGGRWEVGQLVEILAADVRAYVSRMDLADVESAMIVEQLVRRYDSWLRLLDGLVSAPEPRLTPPAHELLDRMASIEGRADFRVSTVLPHLDRADAPGDPAVVDYVLRLARA
jgi:hypothetical protein